MRALVKILVFGVGVLFLALVLYRRLISGPVPTGVPRPLREIQSIVGAVRFYGTEYGACPTGGHATVLRTLLGENPKHIVCIEVPQRSINQRGEFTDPWRTPYDITIVSTNDIRVRSAGPNKQFGDADDFKSWE